MYPDSPRNLWNGIRYVRLLPKGNYQTQVQISQNDLESRLQKMDIEIQYLSQNLTQLDVEIEKVEDCTPISDKYMETHARYYDSEPMAQTYVLKVK